MKIKIKNGNNPGTDQCNKQLIVIVNNKSYTLPSVCVECIDEFHRDDFINLMPNFPEKAIDKTMKILIDMFGDGSCGNCTP